MGIVFLYLLNHLENLSHNSSMDYKETIVQAVLGYINSDCKNASLMRIAEDTHQSMTTLSKLIKQKTGYTFKELLQGKRFQMAVHLLHDTKLSIEEIALDVGYENQSYFFRQFKKRYGMTPHKYRKEYIKDKKR
jgi:YesN/AraC family two-component response regulator